MHYEKFQDGSVKCIENEIPFEIPDKWTWTRLGNIFAHNTGKALNVSDTTGLELTYITTSNLYWDRFELGAHKKMYFTESELEKCTVTNGDLLVCEGGDIGRAAIWTYDENIRIQNHIHRLRAFIPLVNRFYYYVFYLWKLIDKIGGQGIGLQGFSSKALHNLIVPIPPLQEQHNIADKLDAIFTIVNDVEKAKEDVKEIIEQVKSRILDLAIRGKLVPQDPNDEPASVLLERIRAEKEELIKQGKIKRDKKESVIFKGEDNSYYEKIGEEVTCIDDEIPFEIPDNWCWCRMKQLMYLIGGVTYNKRDIQKEGIRILRGGNLTNKNNIKLYDNDIFLPEFYIDRQNQIQDGDIIIVASTGSTTVIGKPAFVESHYPKTQIGGFLKIVRPIDKQAQQILWLLFQSNYYHESILDQVGGVNINNIKSAYLENMLISVPPGRELALIVEKYLQLSLSFSNIEGSLN